MRFRFLSVFILIIAVSRPGAAQSSEAKEVLQLAQEFFDALEKQDTTAFRQMFLPDGYNYAVWEQKDTVMARGRPHSAFRFQQDQKLKERMRPHTTMVKVDGRIAMVWAPYDLWVNETFSHCGVDVFTFLKTSEGWKIASISYTMEKTGCQ